MSHLKDAPSHLPAIRSVVMAPSVVLLLLGLLSRSTSLPPPRTSFTFDSAERRLIHFSLPGVYNSTTLLLSEDSSTLYVGAQNAVLSLDVSQSDVITLKKKLEWSPSDEEIKSCSDKGKNATVDCPNFVRVLQQINSTHLYACGSYAYAPHDAYIDTETFSLVQHDGPKNHCPFNPFHRNTAIFVDGELFTATTTDFRGVKPKISRHFSGGGRPDVSQDTSVSLLDEPTFVSSVLDPAESKLYFFFSEVGNEFSFIDDLRIARVAQVCKDDVGGKRTLQRKWTSFAKAPLLCQSHKQLPFNLLQDVFTVQPPEASVTTDTLFYGVFTSQWSLGPESAVCVFKLQDFRTVFTGSYRSLDMQTHQWSPLQGDHSYLGKCGLDSDSDFRLAEVKRNFLTSSGVKPVGDGPILVSSQQSYSRVAVMRTKAADGKDYTILFLLTESGFLHKVVLFELGAQVIEEIQVFRQPQLVKSILLSSSKGVLFVGTSEGVTAVPVAKCSVYRSCTQCLLARDPLCGWSRTRRVCTGLDSSSDKVAQVLENGNVTEECKGQTVASVDKDLKLHLNKAVRLDCQKPSTLATLTWHSPRFRTLPKELFFQSDDGSLNFHANVDTFGTYRCVAEEGGYKEVVASFNVQQIMSPRSKEPPAYVNREHDTPEEPDESIITEEPMTTIKPPSGDPEEILDENKDEKKVDESIITEDKVGKNMEEPEIRNQSGSNSHSWKEPMGNPKDKTYYSELIVVSFMLVTCILILILAGLTLWRQRKTTLKQESGKGDKSMQNCTEYNGPTLKVEQ